MGQILGSENHANWSVVHTLPDASICSMAWFDEQLFIGTSPNGTIYSWNGETLSTSLENSDQQVACLVEYNGDLFAGTNPSGNVLRFNGARWEFEFQVFGGGISTMTVNGGNLYVFPSYSGNVAVFNGQGWEAMAISVTPPPANLTLSSQWMNATAQSYNLASHRVSTRSVLSEEGLFIDRIKIKNAREAENEGVLTNLDRLAMRPTRDDRFVRSAASGDTLILGTNLGELISYDGTLTTLYQNGGDSLGGVLALAGNVIAFYSNHQLCLWDNGLVPLLDLRRENITAIFGDDLNNCLMVGVDSGRILRVDYRSPNASATGLRSIYGALINGAGQTSESWQNILYQIGGQIIKINDEKETVETKQVSLPIAANDRQSIEATFTTAPMAAPDDFGWWELAALECELQAGTELLFGIKTANSNSELTILNWSTYTLGNGSNQINLRHFNGRFMQAKITLVSLLAGITPSVSKLQISYRTPHAVYFFTKKFVLGKDAIDSGLITARTTTPRFSKVVVGLNGSNTGDWDDYTVVPLDKIFDVPSAISSRFKAGFKLIQYKPTATPEITGFGIVFGGNEKVKINQ